MSIGVLHKSTYSGNATEGMSRIIIADMAVALLID